jgi:hypothetical protein
MAEEATLQTEQKVETQTTSQLLQEAAFGSGVPRETKKEDAPIVEPKKDEEEIVEPSEWLEREFGTKDVAILKAEREELKKLKETPPPQEIKFADDQSKQIYELLREGGEKKKAVRQFLETQEQLDNLASLEVGKDNAEDIIKLQMKLKNSSLTPKEIDFEYKQNYVAPKEPVQKTTETDEEFEERKNEWKEQVTNVEMKKIIAAKLAQPELSKLKTELVLPEIQQKEISTEKKPTQEDLDAFKKEQDSFLQSAQKSITDFNGFSLQVKDKDVDYTVSYTPSQEEKTFLNGLVKKFTESNFNANALLADRWVEDDGKTIKVEQMIKDLSRIYGDDKIDQKLITDSANKRLDAYLKDKKQINVNEQNQNGTFNPSDAKSEMDKVRELAFA